LNENRFDSKTDLMQASDTIVETAPLIEWFAPRVEGDRRIHVSQIIGLTGIICFSFLCCAGAGTIASMARVGDFDREFSSVVLPSTVTLIMVGCYVTTLLTLHTIASSLLPLSFRLILIFAVIYICLRLSTWSADEPILAIHVIVLMPLCIGGFFQRRVRRWRSLAWNQTPQALPLTISGLLDVTTAAALVLTVLTSAIQWNETRPEGVLLFVASALLMAVVGMHCWTRLCALCPISAQAESGYGIWFAINVSIAFFVFLGFLSFNAQSKFAFLAFIIAPAAVLIAHVGTEIPIRWLRGCGWTFERFDDSNRSP
jgi:hypothetical protein